MKMSLRVLAMFAITLATLTTISNTAHAINQWHDFGLGQEVNTYMHGEGSAIQADGTYSIDEYKLKALYVHYILASSRWNGSLKKHASLCTIGQSDFASRMKKLAAIVKPFHFWEVLEGVRVADIKWKCDAVFIGHIYWHPELSRYLGAIKRASKKRPILVIGDDKQLLDQGGMVVFSTSKEDSKIYLDINRDEAEKTKIAFHWEILQIDRSNANILVALR